MAIVSTYSLDDDTSNLVRVGVGGRTTILEVTHLLVVALTVDTDGGATVGNTPGELIKRGSLVCTGHTELVVLTVHLHVLLVASTELLHGLLNGLVSTLFAHLLGRHVAVETCTVPVTWNGLGGKGDLDTKLFGDAVEDEARHPELVTHCHLCQSCHPGKELSCRFVLTGNTRAGTDLVLPLSGHDLGVGTGDEDTCVEAGLVVGLDNVSAEDSAGTYTTVVRTLGSWETVLGPSVRPAVDVKESVLLLKAKPELLALVLLHEKGSGMTEVVLVWLAITHPGLAHDENVGSAAEWVVKHGDWAEVDIRVLARRLTGRGTVKVPFRKILKLDLEVGNFLTRLVLLGLGWNGLEGCMSVQFLNLA